MAITGIRNGHHFATVNEKPSFHASENDKASCHLEESRERVVQAVQGLTETQWKFKAAPDRWSIAEIVEHLALVEDLFLERIVPRLCTGLEQVLDRDPPEADSPQLKPVGRWTPADSLDRFLESRELTSLFFEAPPIALRQLVLDHPELGPVDGYQLVALIAAHTTGLVKHIIGLKANCRFPA